MGTHAGVAEILAPQRLERLIVSKFRAFSDLIGRIGACQLNAKLGGFMAGRGNDATGRPTAAGIAARRGVVLLLDGVKKASM